MLSLSSVSSRPGLKFSVFFITNFTYGAYIARYRKSRFDCIVNRDNFNRAKIADSAIYKRNVGGSQIRYIAFTLVEYEIFQTCRNLRDSLQADFWVFMTPKVAKLAHNDFHVSHLNKLYPTLPTEEIAIILIDVGNIFYGSI